MPFSLSGALGTGELRICGTATRIPTCGFDYVYDGNMIDGPEKDEHHRVVMICSFDSRYIGKRWKAHPAFFVPDIDRPIPRALVRTVIRKSRPARSAPLKVK